MNQLRWLWLQQRFWYLTIRWLPTASWVPYRVKLFLCEHAEASQDNYCVALGYDREFIQNARKHLIRRITEREATKIR